MIRTIQTEEITRNIKEMCIEANHFLAEDMEHAMKKAAEEEKSELGKKILLQLQENLKNCGRRNDSYLSGYRNGCIFCRNRSGRAF